MDFEDVIFNAMVSEIGFEQAHRGMAQIAAKAVAAEIERLRAAGPSLAERTAIDNMRADFGAGRKIMASDASIALRVIDRIVTAFDGERASPKEG